MLLRVGWFLCTYVEYVEMDLAPVGEAGGALAERLAESITSFLSSEEDNAQNRTPGGRLPPAPDCCCPRQQCRTPRGPVARTHAYGRRVAVVAAAATAALVGGPASAARACPSRRPHGSCAFAACATGDSGELSFREGRILRVLDDDGSGWALGGLWVISLRSTQGTRAPGGAAGSRARLWSLSCAPLRARMCPSEERLRRRGSCLTLPRDAGGGGGGGAIAQCVWGAAYFVLRSRMLYESCVLSVNNSLFVYRSQHGWRAEGAVQSVSLLAGESTVPLNSLAQ